MNRKKLVCIMLALINLICASVLMVWANPDTPQESLPAETPTTATTPVVTTDPYGATTPSGTAVDPSVPASTGTSDPLVTDSSMSTAPTELVSTVPATRPAEIASDPGYTSDYVAQPPAFQPGEHDVQKQEWDALEEDQIVKDAEKQLSVSGGSGSGSFKSIKDNKSKGDEKNPLLFILSILCWFVALGLATFAILYRSGKKIVVKSSSGSETKVKNSKSSRAGRYAASKKRPAVKLSEDEYSDGF